VDDSAPTVSRSSRALSAALALALSGPAGGCAARRPPPLDYGVPRCPERARGRLLSDEALQCWFDAPHGRWRTLLRESHFDVLVVRIEMFDTRDAEAIARWFVSGHRDTFAEILIYAQAERPADVSRIRRVRWTPESGFETLDYSEAADDSRERHDD
jgi:hypothetical protein